MVKHWLTALETELMQYWPPFCNCLGGGALKQKEHFSDSLVDHLSFPSLWSIVRWTWWVAAIVVCTRPRDLSCGLYRRSARWRPVHCLMLISHHFFCLLRRHPIHIFTHPSRTILVNVSCRATCPNQTRFRHWTVTSRSLGTNQDCDQTADEIVWLLFSVRDIEQSPENLVDALL